jgi:hypothetical protein
MKQEKYISYLELDIANTGLNRFAVRIRSTFSFVNLETYLSLSPRLVPS